MSGEGLQANNTPVDSDFGDHRNSQSIPDIDDDDAPPADDNQHASEFNQRDSESERDLTQNTGYFDDVFTHLLVQQSTFLI